MDEIYASEAMYPGRVRLNTSEWDTRKCGKVDEEDETRWELAAVRYFAKCMESGQDVAHRLLHIYAEREDHEYFAWMGQLVVRAEGVVPRLNIARTLRFVAETVAYTMSHSCYSVLLEGAVRGGWYAIAAVEPSMSPVRTLLLVLRTLADQSREELGGFLKIHDHSIAQKIRKGGAAVFLAIKAEYHRCDGAVTVPTGCAVHMCTDNTAHHMLCGGHYAGIRDALLCAMSADTTGVVMRMLSSVKHQRWTTK